VGIEKEYAPALEFKAVQFGTVSVLTERV
jgi:hypothetical protein